MIRRRKSEILKSLRNATFERVHELYVVQGLSKKTLCKKLKLPLTRVNILIHEYKLSDEVTCRPGRRIHIGDPKNRAGFIQDISELYIQGKSQLEIATELKTTCATISRLLRKNNVKTRRSGRVGSLDSVINIENIKKLIADGEKISVISKKINQPYHTLYNFIKSKKLLPLSKTDSSTE